MSLLPLNPSSENQVWYGDSKNREETELLVGVPGKPRYVEFEVAEVIYELFITRRGYDLSENPKTNPKRAPEKRFRRHRNFYVWKTNQFRHWWKTSRLLVRTSGGYEYCVDQINWETMASYLVHKRRQSKKALKSMKAIGRGGPSRDFLSNVKPFTRTIRIALAVARGWEARVDNRLYEVSIAEAFAFMGNRCSRWIARTLVDGSTKNLAFPLSVKFLEPYLDQNSRPIIVTMGFIRAILPFAFSFTGSAIGRQLTFNTYKFANFRWQPVQSVMRFNMDAGVYQDTMLDLELQSLAHDVAVAIGRGKDPVETRQKMAILKFKMVGAGQGGYSVYRLANLEAGIVFFAHITPYGPSIMDEMPRYIVLERKKTYHVRKDRWELPDANLLDAALPPETSICGFTYSGAFFKSQEWAALATKFDETLAEYDVACRRLGTKKYLGGTNPIRTPPTDLLTMKDFIRSGDMNKKKRKDAKRWKEIGAQVKKMSNLVAKYQKKGTAPKRVILYLEGLDCSAKSSTGGLICLALEDCGYAVRTAQHNRPPTAEQRKKPWMDRGRFEYPDDVYAYGEDIPEYTAVVWDRGPVGDFVYGKFSELTSAQKMEKYEEFRKYDALCREEGVLFIKLLFVADKDSIASTLGKRLAHKKIARDLHTWLDANSIEHARPGLDEIEAHIDPTDFIAFNQYKSNLSIFTDVARNTNDIAHDGCQTSESTIGYHNPWTVVNTCKRHPARLELLKTFERQLKFFAEDPGEKASVATKFRNFFQLSAFDADVTRPVPKNYVEDRSQGLSIRALFQSMILFGLLYFYAYVSQDGKLHFLAQLRQIVPLWTHSTHRHPFFRAQITWKFDLQEYA